MFIQKFFKYSFLTTLALPSILLGKNVTIHESNQIVYQYELPQVIDGDELYSSISRTSLISEDEFLLVSEGVKVLKSDRLLPFEGQTYFMIKVDNPIPKKSHHGYRDYQKGFTDEERGEIHYILKSCALKSLPSLWSNRHDLEKAGDRIDHIHPLRFLECTFTDPENVVYIHNIKKRGSWVWDDFTKGLKSSLSEESQIDNIKSADVAHFSATLGLNGQVIQEYVKGKKWDAMIKYLLQMIKPQGGSGRYDQ